MSAYTTTPEGTKTLKEAKSPERTDAGEKYLSGYREGRAKRGK